MAHLTTHTLVVRQFAVRTGADAQIIAKGPVVQVVPALMAGTGKGRSFIVRIARFGQAVFQPILDLGTGIVIGQSGRRHCGKGGVRLQRQLITGKMRWVKGQCLMDISQCRCHILLWQPDHEIEVKGIEGAGGSFNRRNRLLSVVNAAQRLQAGIVETLNTEGEAINPCRLETGEAFSIYGTWVGLQRNFGLRRQWQQHAETGDQSINGSRR